MKDQRTIKIAGQTVSVSSNEITFHEKSRAFCRLKVIKYCMAEGFLRNNIREIKINVPKG